MNASPLYLESAKGCIFTWFHRPDRPDGTTSGRGVLVCPPWGWDEVASYRGRRRWAELLAIDGHAALRIDLLGTGDSAGDPDDGDQVERWVYSIGEAARWLVAQPHIESVTALGLGVGSLLALHAVDQGAPIGDIVVWSTYQRGRRFVRAARTFAATQSGPDSARAQHDAEDPVQRIEANGFVLNSETIDSLNSLDAKSMSTGSLRRALLLDPDGLVVDHGFEEHLRREGVDVQRSGGAGWADLTAHPERCVLSTTLVEQVRGWLATADVVEAPIRSSRIEADTSIAAVSDGLVRESPLTIPMGNGAMFAVASEPSDEGVTSDACAVFLNAGAVRRVGPNRMWVTVARRWAAMGIPSLRVDAHGIGDGGGTQTHPDGVEALYAPERIKEVHTVLDVAASRWPGRRIIVVGLCSGGYWAFRAAQEHESVSEAVAFNPGALVWRSDTAARHRARKLMAWRDRGAVVRLARGQIRPRVVLDALGGLVGIVASLPARRRDKSTGVPSVAAEMSGAFADICESGRRLTIAFSSGENVESELAAYGLLPTPDRWPGIEVLELPGGDHTLRPLYAQRAAMVLLDEVAERCIGMSSAISGT